MGPRGPAVQGVSTPVGQAREPAAQGVSTPVDQVCDGATSDDCEMSRPEHGSVDEASAFLDQARSLFDAEQQLGPAVDVWGIGLRAGIDRAESRDELADSRFEAARELSPEIWSDERLSAAELR